MENRAMVKILSLAERSKADLENLMSYRFTEVCLPIFNINGQMRKAVKAKLVDCFLMEEAILDNVAYISIIDIGYPWRLAAPTTSDREKKDKFTWGDYAEKIFKMIVQRHPHAKEYYLLNDRYDVELPIKDAEHQKINLLFIGGAENVHPSRNDPVSPLRKFNAFFVNSANEI